MSTDRLTRRTALTGAAVAGVGAPLLAACSGSTDTASDPQTQGSATPEDGASSGDAGSGGSEALTTTTEVPVGGGVILADAKVVVTQPEEGTFKGFSAVCTHQGCLVSKITETIDCTCHNSTFSLEDGSVQGGPATAPLPAVELTVDGDQITRA